MAVLHAAIHSTGLKFIRKDGYSGPSHWNVRLKVDPTRVNDAFVLLPKTVDRWKTAVRFEDQPGERVWLHNKGNGVFEAQVRVQDTNALDMSKRVVVGFNGGFDWGQGWGESVKLNQTYGSRD